jgi:hypothetical protein
MALALTPPFPVAGAGLIFIESVLAMVLVSSFWVTYPRGFGEIGVILAVLLATSFGLVSSLGQKALASPNRSRFAKVIVVIGAVLGLAGLVLGLAAGPHLAGICIWGLGAQVVVLLAGRVVCAA